MPSDYLIPGRFPFDIHCLLREGVNHSMRANRMENSTNMRKYRVAPSAMAYEKPKLIAQAMARADPKTEPIPFIPHILAIR